MANTAAVPVYSDLSIELQALREQEEWRAYKILSSGTICAVKVPRSTLSTHHLLVYYPGCQGEPTSKDREEMLLYAFEIGQTYGKKLFGDPEAYSILHNGRGNARAVEIHFHVFILHRESPQYGRIGEVFQKLAEKNL